MKKWVFCLVLFFVMCGAANAKWLVQGLTTGSSSGTYVDEYSTHTVAVILTDADTSVTALTVALEGSIDAQSATDANATWASLASHTFTSPELTALAAMFHVANKPINRVRATIVTFTGSGTGDSIDVLYTGR